MIYDHAHGLHHTRVIAHLRCRVVEVNPFSIRSQSRHPNYSKIKNISGNQFTELNLKCQLKLKFGV